MLWLDRDLAALPGATTKLYRRLEQSELVCPCGEAALTPIAVELRQDREHRVGGGLVGEIVEVASSQVRMGSAAAVDLEPCRSQEEVVQLPPGVLTGRPLDAEGRHPGPRLGVWTDRG